MDGFEAEDTVELSAVDLVLLGARLYALFNRGATLREVLELIASTGDIEPDYYIASIRRVVDGGDVTL